MSQSWLHYIASGIAILLLLLFLILYGRAVVLSWRQPDAPVEFGQPYVYTSTVLAGLVGGVAAMLYNENLPAPTTPPPGAAAMKSDHRDHVRPAPASGPEAAKVAVVKTVTSTDTPLAIVSAAYLISYVLIGVAAIATWVMVGEKNTADLVKNLALVSIGLLVAITRTVVPH